jgi:inosose dehydratase
MLRQGVELAGGPVSWGVDFARAPGNPPYAAVLDGITAAGLRWLELGPVGYLPRDAETARAALGSRGLAAVGTFVFDDFHRPAARTDVLTAVDEALDAITATEGALLILIDRPCSERARTAGRGTLARRLERVAWGQMISTLQLAAERAHERGVRAVLHPHAGSYIEFEDEIERALADVPAELLALCLDTGHAIYAGSDPVALIQRHATRLEHLHLKDARADVISRGLDFWDAIAAGVFCPVGDGALDLVATREALERVSYSGFATIEQDRRPGTVGAPGEDLRRSVEFVRSCGVG